MRNHITSKARLIALLGDPVEHSLSPQMHNMAFEQLGLDYVYLSIRVRENELAQAVAGMKLFSARGFNITMPHKKSILPYLDELSKEAQWIGSVNTVLNDNGRLIGYNTDGKGYVRSLLDEKISVAGKKIVMVGSGGATRSVAIQLAMDDAGEMILINRTLSKAEEICGTIEKNIPMCRVKALELKDSVLEEELKNADILINCTPLGMHPNEGKCIISGPDMLHPELIVSDLIYNPRKTKLLEMAEQAGCKTLNGLGMLIWQGALAFKIWTGGEMPVADVKKAVFSDR